MKANWQMWSLVSAAFVLLASFGKLDLLAIAVPLSLAVGYGTWVANRGNAPGGAVRYEQSLNENGPCSK
jgi:hypothetical protein